jgi:hypothetical protein
MQLDIINKKQNFEVENNKKISLTSIWLLSTIAVHEISLQSRKSRNKIVTFYTIREKWRVLKTTRI